MKKIFSRSKRSKEKEKQREEQKEENDFLYGRAKSRPVVNAPHNNNPDIGDTNTSPISHPDIELSNRRDTEATENSRDRSKSPSSYRVESNEAVSSRHNRAPNSVSNSEVPAAASAVGGSSNQRDLGDGTLDGANKDAEWDAPQAHLAGGGKTSGMSQDEIDKLANQRPKIERRRHKISFEEGQKSSHIHNEEENQDIRDDAHKRRPRRKDSKHRHSDSKPKSNGNADDGEFQERRRRSTEKDEKDRKMKQSIREQRDAAKDIRKHAQSYNGGDQEEKDRKMKQIIREQRDAANELEDRRRRQIEREEKDRKIKQTIREQRDAAKDLRKSSQPYNGDGELEDRRRHQIEREEKDRKIKQSIREQKAKDLGRRAPSYNGDGELEDRRRRQVERDEKDRKMKQSIRQQRDAVKDLRKSSQSYDGGGELEDRRRRQVEQDKKDRKMKQNIRQQRDAVKDLRKSNQSYDGCEEFGESHHIREEYEEGLTNDNYQYSKQLSIGDDRDPFEEALQSGAVVKSTKGRGTIVHENLIDLHIAQYRATTKIEDGEDYDDCNADLEEFELDELKRNRVRRVSRRDSTTTMKIKAWQQKYSLKKALQLAERTPGQEWVSSFYRCDPRWQIMRFFDEVAREGGEAPMDENLAASPLANLFNKANVFTVWRPTSGEAIKNMMLGIATGKGLDIKGKSAKRGNISSYVPFIQIYDEFHKEHIRALIKDGRVVRIFYQTAEARIEALEMLLDIKDFMLFAAEDAMRVLSDEYADEAEQNLAMKHLMYDDTNLAVEFVDTYVNSSTPVFGLDITERLFWESYVMMQDCSRPTGTDWDIGRNSEPTFMDMNFKAIRHTPAPGDPRAVVYQMSTSPMEPRMLLMAYEEYGTVKPVVSDFDCFLLGSRGVKYKNPIPSEQIELVKWSVNNISEVLDERARSDLHAGWMETWFKVLKKAALKGYYPKTPKYGNGDPKSYEIIKVAVDRLQKTGCVRHGAECFNWFFPQEIDDELLVISDTLPGNVKWKKVNPRQLQDLLIEKIDEGFTFPINPKWVLCDPGWRRVYDKLLSSQKPNVQDSINCWLPPETGLRKEIDMISARHPLGFSGVEAEGKKFGMHQVEYDLERYIKIQRSWRKLRLVLFWIRFVREKKREREEMESLDRFSGKMLSHYRAPT
ncbi:hypothetical protein ACHAXR_009860 [Thalassiosira sp. AJA248-18]